jgi:hypothetical protein
VGYFITPPASTKMWGDFKLGKQEFQSALDQYGSVKAKTLCQSQFFLT